MCIYIYIYICMYINIYIYIHNCVLHYLTDERDKLMYIREDTERPPKGVCKLD